MPDRIDSGIDPKFFEEFKQANLAVIQLNENLINASKQQINIEVSGASSKTLVDLHGNQIKLAEATKETKMNFDSLEVSLGRVSQMEAQYNGSTDTLIGLSKKAASAEKELEAAQLQRAKAETEASKARLNDAKAEEQAAKTLLAQRKLQIAEERELNRLILEEEKEKQAAIIKTAETQKAAKSAAILNTPLTITNESATGTNAANADGTVVNAEETAALNAQRAAQAELGVATQQTTAAQAEQTAAGRSFIAMTEAEILAEKEAETTMIAMAAQLKILQAEYKTLTATQRESAEGLALNTQISGLDKEVKALDASLGNSQRNVGNYGSAFEKAADKALSLDNVAAKLVTSFVRMGVHFLAFTIIIKGIEYIVEQFTGFGKAADKTEKILEKYQTTLKGIDDAEAGAAQQSIAHAQVLAKVAADRDVSDKNRLRAVLELQKTYPDTFGNLTKEAILEGNVAAAIKATTDQLKERALVQAAEKKIAAAGEKQYDLTLQQRIEQTKLNALQSQYNSLLAAGQANPTNRFLPNAALEAGRELDRTKDKVEKLTAEIKKSDNEINGYLNDAATHAPKAGQTLFGADPKAPRVKAIPDHAAQEYAGQKRAE